MARPGRSATGGKLHRPLKPEHVNRQSHVQLVLQSFSCFHRSLPKNISALLDGSDAAVARCGLCIKRKSRGSRGLSANGDRCRFAGLRIFHFAKDGKSLSDPGVSFLPRQSSVLHPIFREVFSRDPTRNDVNCMQTACVTVLLPMLKEELIHLKQPKLLVQDVVIEQRELCDACAATLFVERTFCSSCGEEFCGDCSKGFQMSSDIAPTCISQQSASSPHQFIPVSSFQEDLLCETIGKMSMILEACLTPSKEKLSGEKSAQHPDAPVLRRGDYFAFKRQWSMGTPIVVKGIQLKGTSQWCPNYFSQRHGAQRVTIINCETGETRVISLAQFMATMGGLRIDGEIWKVKDWPPKEDFKDVFPDLDKAFQDGVPFGHYTRRDGVLNYASYFPTNGVFPDLGPKMYIAKATPLNTFGVGSTILHMDVTSAVNLLIWASKLDDSSDGYALWHIFTAEDSLVLRQFLRDEGIYREAGDPIHSQSIFLTQELLERLDRKRGIQPYTIKQYMGDAVFIPAGCAHQVSNKADAIKIASDFICAANLTATVNVSRELRRHRLANGKDSGEDVLQIATTLHHAWKALEEVRSRLIDDDISACSSPPSYLIDKRLALIPSHFCNDGEVQPSLPAMASTESEIIFRCQPMNTTSSGPEVAKEAKKKAKRLKKFKQREAKWVRDFGAAGEGSLVERFLCPLCPGLQRRYPRSTLLCHLIDRHHTGLALKSVTALRTAQSERKLCKPGKVSSTDYLAEVQKLLVLKPATADYSSAQSLA